MAISAAATRLSRLRAKAGRPLQPVTPWNVHKFQHGTVETIPDIIEFVVSDRYLNRPNIYPRQATFLKVMFLQTEIMTQYDYDVIGEWEEKFLQTGTEGISPGIFQRMEINRAQGRKWFRETEGVIGRRGSKGYTGGIAGSYVLWNYMMKPGGPQNYYGIDRDKQLVGIVFAGKKEQARDNQWKDLFNVITTGPCFAKYVSKPQTERLTVFAPYDFVRADEQMAMGVQTETDLASFSLIPAPSTVMAGRGPTSFMQFYDEQAHVINSTSNADAEAVYDAATPSLDQFGKDGFIYAPSSPWTKQGKFFQNYELAIEMEPNGTPSYPERLMLQLPSWGPYEDWEEAHRIPMRPAKRHIEVQALEIKRHRVIKGKHRTVTSIEERPVEVVQLDSLGNFRPLKKAIQAYDDDMRQLQRANPETFKVERLSQWAESLNAYLNPTMVERAFAPWNGQMLFIEKAGVLADTYSAHGDPANTNKRFGWSMARRVWVPGTEKEDGTLSEGMWHVVFARVNCWEPADYPDHTLDYEDVMGDIWEDVKNFTPEDVSFDQFNVPATIGWLRKKLAKEQLPKQVQVHEVTRTARLNWSHAELFKAALNMGLVHIPMFLRERDPESGDWKINYASSEVEQELKFLEEKNNKVDHPSSGPVQTKDIADTIMEVTVSLIGKQMASLLGQELSDLGLSGGAPRGTDPGRHTRTDADEAGDRLTGSMGSPRGMGAARVGSPAARGMARRGRR